MIRWILDTDRYHTFCNKGDYIVLVTTLCIDKDVKDDFERKSIALSDGSTRFYEDVLEMPTIGRMMYLHMYVCVMGFKIHSYMVRYSMIIR